MKTFKTMFRVELTLSLRDMNMVLFAIVMPLIVLVIYGIIYGTRPAGDGLDYTYIEQSFGALCGISICAGGAMGLPLLVADCREKKLLKRYKVTPISEKMILTVHLAIYSLYALVSMVLIWLAATIFLKYKMDGSFFLFIGSWVLVLVTILSVGMLIGGVAKNSQQASLIATILYFAMLIFSGATLPYEKMPKILQYVSDVMPLTQGIKLLKVTSLGLGAGDMLIPAISMGVCSLLCIFLSIKFFKWE